MSVHNTIVLDAAPAGRFFEGYISGTPLPGTIMQIKSATAMRGGRHTFEVYNRDADGDRPKGPLFVLQQNYLMGKGIEDAYADGERGYLYCPMNGSEVKARVAVPGTGTGNAVAIGQIFTIDDGTGLLIFTTGTPEIEPFMSMEALADVTATGTLCHVIYSGY